MKATYTIRLHGNNVYTTDGFGLIPLIFEMFNKCGEFTVDVDGRPYYWDEIYFSTDEDGDYCYSGESVYGCSEILADLLHQFRSEVVDNIKDHRWVGDCVTSESFTTDGIKDVIRCLCKLGGVKASGHEIDEIYDNVADYIECSLPNDCYWIPEKGELWLGTDSAMMAHRFESFVLSGAKIYVNHGVASDGEC